LRTTAELKSQPTAVRPVPPALAVAPRKPDYVPGQVAQGGAPDQAARAGIPELDALLDSRTKRKARSAPIGIFILVVFAILIFLALRH
jgi:hypothetical protein